MTIGIVNELTEAEFSKAIKDKKSKLVIVDFYAVWCPPCAMMKPVLDSLAEKVTNVKFYKINVDGAPKVSMQYEITNIPCMVFFKEGKEIDRVIGAMSEETLNQKIDNSLGM